MSVKGRKFLFLPILKKSIKRSKSSRSRVPVRVRVLTKVDWKEEHGRDINALNVQNLERMNGGHGEGRRLFVSVVQLVEMLVEERSVVDPVGPVSQVILS